MNPVSVPSSVAILLLCAVVARSQAETTSPSSTIVMDGRDIMGLACDSGSLWATHAEAGQSDVVRISKIDLLTQQATTLGTYNWNGRGVCVGAGSLWVTDARNDRIHRVDPLDGHEIGSFPTPGTEPCGIAFDGTDLWLTDPWFRKIYRLNVGGQVLGSFPIPNEYRWGLEWANDCGGMWTSAGGASVLHYTVSGTIDAAYQFASPPSPSSIVDVAIDGSTWYMSSGNTIHIEAGPACSSPEYSTIGFAGREVLGLTSESGTLWATHAPVGESDSTTVCSIDLQTYRVTDVGSYNWNARGICVAEGSLWVTDALNDKVHRVNPANGEELSSFDTPGTEPCGITYGGANLWLSDPWYQRVYQLNTNGAQLSSFAIPDHYRWALEFSDPCSGMWTDIDATSIGHYTGGGVMDATFQLACPMSGSRMQDVTFDGNKIFASSGNTIYAETGPSDCPPVADVDDEATNLALAGPAMYPNPSSGPLWIRYSLPTASPVTLEIFDAAGALVRRLGQGPQAAGQHRVVWNGCDNAGARLPSGIYFASVRTALGVTTDKFVVTR